MSKKEKYDKNQPKRKKNAKKISLFLIKLLQNLSNKYIIL